ncbi:MULTISPECIES: YafY family protein [unclassified Streptomyces]|uniref:helix-turn-helix transcriptional regulator n=1 Tax=unclassified Streptomyces TaxID=2593676 RepID=UPI0008900FB8|nr:MULTISPECIES: WYL domain-containing protein [unclassified Streptomyces]PBC82003.1 putative DNA-binding transcriptional regulator YafY [Streptomyces sp. 2321.6]SDR51981.1 Predicted DNA-binding transcriptional regulator YafY, contains an HTH and WYL domains [Streptomyces sp. KS_16]SEC39598.1 Predicted DNA-binding transcriptional regulator YafY, contains an HTH and WYL domains [Streptomyces sp. 2133.1]SNC67151.1 Predicted DNA-binding transcriptional regulator YafY, contains an HTH and WYL domai
MRAARLIKMVLLLQARPSMTAAELARELEVSERTVARDVLSLSEAGVPVYADRGRAGGYRLIGGYRTRLTGLGRSEAEALFLSGVPSALREMGLADAASAARLKVSAALLPELRDAATGAAQRFHLDAPGWYQEPETPALLPEIADAVWDDRRITARYLRKDTEVERELEPYGLVLKAGVWYLAARTQGDYRVYRVDRFTTVATAGNGNTSRADTADDAHNTDNAGGRFTRDVSFDLPEFWAQRAAQFARSILREEVVLRLSPRGVSQLPYVTERAAAREAIARAQTADGPDEHGRLTVTLAVESAEVAYAQLLALGPEGDILAPPELRERFASAARRMAALYPEGAAAGAGPAADRPDADRPGADGPDHSGP